MTIYIYYVAYEFAINFLPKLYKIHDSATAHSLPLSLCVLSSNAYLSTHTLKKYEETYQLLLLLK